MPSGRSHVGWDGFYVGGQFGYSQAKVDFGRAFNSANIFDPRNGFTAPFGRVDNWAALGSNYPSTTSYGGFIGYNSVWEDAVLGVEINYNHRGVRGSASASRCYSATDLGCITPAIVLGDGNSYNATLTATASAYITDYATVRARGGWAYGKFMPYAMIGLAVGRVETKLTAVASGTPTAAGLPFTSTEQAVGTQYSWGYGGGVGVDFMLLPHVFLRAEYEYMQLNSVLDNNIGVNSARVGAGVKF